MRVALVTDMFLPRRGGIELHVADLAARLRDAGHHVDVLTAFPGPGGAGVARLALPLLPVADVTIDPRLFARLDAALAAGRYDVAHCHASVFSPAAWVGLWAARRHGIPAVLTFHSVLRSAGGWLGAMHRLFGVRRWPVAVTGVSALVAEQARRAAPGAPIGVLPNGTDVAWWSRPAGRARPLPPPRRAEELHVVCAMRLTRKKRPEVLVRAAASLRAALGDAGPRVRVTIAGEGPERERLGRLVRELALGDVVSFPGWCSRAELRALYHAADVFALPARDEAFGIAALEARAAGLAVLAYRGTGIVDFTRDGVHGHLCASDDDLAARLLALARDPAALRALAARSRAEPPTAYDWRAVVARHEAAYVAAGAAAGVPLSVRPDLPHVPRYVPQSRRRAAARRR